MVAPTGDNGQFLLRQLFRVLCHEAFQQLGVGKERIAQPGNLFNELLTDLLGSGNMGNDVQVPIGIGQQSKTQLVEQPGFFSGQIPHDGSSLLYFRLRSHQHRRPYLQERRDNGEISVSLRLTSRPTWLAQWPEDRQHQHDHRQLQQR